MNASQLLAAGLLLLTPLLASAQTRTNAPAPPSTAKTATKPAPAAAPAPSPAASFDAFKNVPDRNIFNSRRFAGRTTETAAPPPTTRRDPVIETFSLLGTLDYPKGSVAFFEGSSASHRKAVAVGETIGDCKITSVEANLVRLVSADKPLELKVGYMLRREDQGEWKMREAERPSDYGSSASSSSSSPFGSGSSSPFGFSSSSGSSRDSRSSSSGRDSRSSSSFGSGSNPADMAQQRIREQDRNGDGKISRTEADSRLRDRFRDMDRNRDDQIDAEEYTAYYTSRMGGSTSSAPPTSSFNSGSTSSFNSGSTSGFNSGSSSASPGTFGSGSAGSSSSPPASTPSSGGSGESDLLKRLMEQRARENR